MAGSNNLPTKILVIDDDPTVASSIEQGLQKHHVQVLKASDLESAYYHFNQNRLDVAVVEMDFGPLPGLALIQKWRSHEVLEKQMTGFIMLGAGNQRTAGQEGLLRELADLEILNKPVNPIQLLPMLARALTSKNRLATFQDMKQRFVDPYVKQGNIPKAIERVQQMIAEVGERATRLLLDLYETSGRYQDCLETALLMLEEDNNNIYLINTAGRMNMKLGKFKEARPFLERADQLAPTNLERMNQIAHMYLQVNEPEKSIAVFKQLIELNPESPDYKFEVFKKLYDAGYDEQAIGFGKEVAQPMEIVRHYNNKGVLLAKESKQDEALVEYERALGFFPKFKENYRIYYNMALAH
ncbi:MAG: tetratricopeptide repeat protein, partial [Proteobacteria bacterium]|nr:tetratricopeptide repeat protein [Pseudomonadota bacterium]